MNTIIEKINFYNRDPVISPWFREQLVNCVDQGNFIEDPRDLHKPIVEQLVQYKRDHHDIPTVMVGMSGGIDSALTAALFADAGYAVNGVIMPIHQKEQETQRGLEACEALGIRPLKVDLTLAYDKMIAEVAFTDPEAHADTLSAAKRRGNLRARLRMITLYHQASLHKGIVAGTDNFSELAAGFWTLHGDVGDVSPIQSLLKSWEVPVLADYMRVPQSIIQAVPTDGLGISHSDEDQFGFSYLEFDLVLLGLLDHGTRGLKPQSDQDQQIVNSVAERIRSTTHKRNNPVNLDHPVYPGRFFSLDQLDTQLRRKT